MALVQSLIVVLQRSPHSLVAFGLVLSFVSFLSMLTMTVVLVAVGGRLDTVLFGMLVAAHMLAQCSAVVRIAAIYSEERGWKLWRRGSALASVLVDVLQFAYLAHSIHQKKVDAGCDTLVLLLGFILLLDVVGAVWLRDVVCFEDVNKGKPQLEVDTFILKKGQRAGVLGRPALAEQPCHICLEDLQEGDTVGQLPCEHIFHEECIKTWMQRGRTCPLRCACTTGPEALEAQAATEPAAEVGAAEEARRQRCPSFTRIHEMLRTF
mmetsp:Transcript_28657/g.52167  ORF Transcript_28657/g.52167 Transcript_28657/m.52167 type:complete len:265 (-) Transcript_28657:179-973(-)